MLTERHRSSPHFEGIHEFMILFGVFGHEEGVLALCWCQALPTNFGWESGAMFIAKP